MRGPRTHSQISRRGFLAGSALVAGGVLAGCDAGTTSSSKSSGGGKTVTLTVMYKSNEMTKDHIAAFESKNSGIKIQFIEYDATRLNAMLASGNPPDFVRYPAVGSANANARGLTTPLDDYLAKSSVLKKDDLLAVNDGFRWDGKTVGQGPYYGISKDWSQDATLWYNRSLFTAAKITPLSPTDAVTYDQLLDIGKKLTVKSGGKTQVYGLGVEWAWGLYGPLATMIAQQGGQVYSTDLVTTDLSTAEAKRAIQWFVDFGQAGVGPTSLDPLPDGADLATFMAKRMAVTQDGFWYGGNFSSGDGTKMQTDIAMAPAPVMGDKRISPCYAGWGAMIPAKSKLKDEAWKLMEFFMAGPPAVERAKSGWGLPALKSLLPQVPQDLAYQKQAYQTSQNELTYAGLLPNSPYVTIDNWIAVLDKYITQAIKKQLTVDACCAAITTDVNKLLKQGKDQIG
ncbi:MAG TPA: sugar ABC transporter substrate-binding protein [Rugosimonospora sp.]|nr:sugar ABC transporter substrate-binding protein [Rugosimonospora sp.]